MNLLETKQLSFSYKNQQVLKNINLAIPQGCIYGYLGKNGAGKSTTIKVLLGLQEAPSHTIFYKGKEVNHYHEVFSNIGNLIETSTYYASLTGYENLKYLDLLYHCGEKRIEEVLELIGLKKESNKKVKYFSTGMKQRLGIGMAIFHNPDFLILDEPFNGLDPEGIFDMRNLLINLKDEGKTVFFSTHILGEVEKLCTYIGILHRGNLLFQGKFEDLPIDSSLETTFLHLTADNHE